MAKELYDHPNPTLLYLKISKLKSDKTNKTIIELFPFLWKYMQFYRSTSAIAQL